MQPEPYGTASLLLRLHRRPNQPRQVCRVPVVSRNARTHHVGLSHATPINPVPRSKRQLGDEFTLGAAVALPKRMQHIDLAQQVTRELAELVLTQPGLLLILRQLPK